MTADQRGTDDPVKIVEELTKRFENSKPEIAACEYFPYKGNDFTIGVISRHFGYDARIFLNGKVVKELPGNGETFVRSLAEKNPDIAITELVDQAKLDIEQGKFTANP